MFRRHLISRRGGVGFVPGGTFSTLQPELGTATKKMFFLYHLGIEPKASEMQTQRSTTELVARQIGYRGRYLNCV